MVLLDALSFLKSALAYRLLIVWLVLNIWYDALVLCGLCSTVENSEDVLFRSLGYMPPMSIVSAKGMPCFLYWLRVLLAPNLEALPSKSIVLFPVLEDICPKWEDARIYSIFLRLTPLACYYCCTSCLPFFLFVDLLLCPLEFFNSIIACFVVSLAPFKNILWLLSVPPVVDLFVPSF